jgi:hypothetical protein
MGTREAEEKDKRSLRHQRHCGAVVTFVECLCLDFVLHERNRTHLWFTPVFFSLCYLLLKPTPNLVSTSTPIAVVAVKKGVFQ